MKGIAKDVMTKISSVAIQEEKIEIAQITDTRMKLRNFDCYEPAVERVAEKCFSFTVSYFNLLSVKIKALI